MKDILSPLLWPLMEIKYLCRMRTVEVVALTDAHASEQGREQSDEIIAEDRRQASHRKGAI